MKAAVVRAFDQAPRYETFERPSEGEGVVVDVLAAAMAVALTSSGSATCNRGSARVCSAIVPSLSLAARK